MIAITTSSSMRVKPGRGLAVRTRDKERRDMMKLLGKIPDRKVRLDQGKTKKGETEDEKGTG
jgi:hypothetical protein